VGERDGGTRILVVDDARDTVEVLRRNLESRSFRVLTATNVAQARAVLGRHAVDLVITDMRMPGGSGLELVRHVHENEPDAEVLVITGYATVEGAVEAVKAGAESYLAKPFTGEELFAAVEAALAKLRRRRAFQAAPEGAVRPCWGLVGESEGMQRVRRAVARLARSFEPVLVVGERGSGRRQVARALHAAAGARGWLYELRLAEGGGAGSAEPAARLEAVPAACGTLYFPDVTDATAAAQERVLEAACGAPAGAGARVVASTTLVAEAALAAGWLAPALAAHVIELPPLRQREEDVPLLAAHFLHAESDRAGRPVPRLSDGALRTLLAYHWPGNVGELRDTALRWVAAGLEAVEVSDLPEAMRLSPRGEGERIRTLHEVEWEHIQAVLAQAQGNKSRAAELLGIDRKTLREKLRRPPGPG